MSGWNKWLVCAWVVLPLVAAAQFGGGNRELSQAEVHVATEAVRAGDRVPIAVRLVMADGWYTYAEEPGDAGMPPSIRIEGLSGLETGAWRFPPEERFEDAMGISFGYKGEVVLLNELLLPDGLDVGMEVELTVHINWMICLDVCVLMRDVQSVSFQVAERTGEPGESWQRLLEGGGWTASGETGQGTKGPGRE